MQLSILIFTSHDTFYYGNAVACESNVDMLNEMLLINSKMFSRIARLHCALYNLIYRIYKFILRKCRGKVCDV